MRFLNKIPKLAKTEERSKGWAKELLSIEIRKIKQQQRSPKRKTQRGMESPVSPGRQTEKVFQGEMITRNNSAETLRR